MRGVSVWQLQNTRTITITSTTVISSNINSENSYFDKTVDAKVAVDVLDEIGWYCVHSDACIAWGGTTSVRSWVVIKKSILPKKMPSKCKRSKSSKPRRRNSKTKRCRIVRSKKTKRVSRKTSKKSKTKKFGAPAKVRDPWQNRIGSYHLRPRHLYIPPSPAYSPIVTTRVKWWVKRMNQRRTKMMNEPNENNNGYLGWHKDEIAFSVQT